MPNEVDDSDLLQNCPFCDYSLHTLPQEHICPECGQPFDRRWRVFGTQSDWQKWTRPHRAFITTIMVMTTAAVFIRISDMALRILNTTPVTWSVLIRIGTVYAGVSVLVLGVIYAILKRSRRFVILDEQGVAIQHRRRGTVERYAWDTIEKARLSLDVEIVLSVRGHARPVSLLRTSKEEAKACISVIKMFKARGTSLSDSKDA